MPCLGYRRHYLHSGDGFSCQGAPQMRFKLWVHSRNNLADKLAQMLVNRRSVHLRKLPVDADVPQVGAQEGKADGSTVIECLQMGEALAWRRTVGDIPPEAGGEHLRLL